MQLITLLLLAALSNSASTRNEPALDSLISAVRKITIFFSKEYEEFNLDGIFGFRILLEQIKATSEKWASKINLKFLRLNLQEMAKKIEFTIKKSLPYVKQQDPQYFNAFKDILSDFFWVVPSSWNQTNAQLVYSHLVDSECYNEEFNEEFSDYCYRLVLGTWNNAGEPCIVSEPCLAHMTRPGCVNYTLSHQLLYFMTANMKGCSQGLFLQQYAHYTDVFCANMMRRNLEIESDGFPPKEKDLFMENIMLCGLSGYSDFYKSDWMDTIISWQDPCGCFGSTDKLPKAKKESPILWRYKRREKKMPSGCLSHMTAVAAGALGGFLYSFQI